MSAHTPAPERVNRSRHAMTWHAWFLSGAVGLSILATGCESSSDDAAFDPRSGQTISRDAGEEQLPRDAVRVGDERTLTNIAAGRRDRGLYYTPTRAGRIYVRDED